MLEGNEWLTRIVVPTNDTISLVHASASLNDLSSTVLIGDEEIILPGMDYGIPELTPKGCIIKFLTTLLVLYFVFTALVAQVLDLKLILKNALFSKLVRIEII